MALTLCLTVVAFLPSVNKMNPDESMSLYKLRSEEESTMSCLSLKKLVMFMILFNAVVLSNKVLANSICVNNLGILNCGQGAVDTINFMGLININKTKVNKSLDILGKADIKYAMINGMHVRGGANISYSTISGYMDNTGDIYVHNVLVNCPTSVVGNLYGNQVTFNSVVHVVGMVNCYRCTFEDEVTLIGDLNIFNSTLKQTITANSRECMFVNTKINDLVMKRSNDNNQQVVKLDADSVANNITFEGANGKVILTGHSTVKGKVVGAKVIVKP
jgi:hypothetical protein